MFTDDSVITLGELVIKPLYYLLRPAVQQQLGAIVLAMLATWLVGHKLKPLARQLAPKAEKVAEPEPVYTQEFEEPVKLSGPAPVSPTLSHSQRLRRHLLVPLPHLVFPSVGLIALLVARLVVAALGGFVGLIDEFMVFLLLVLGYQLFLGVLYASFSEETVRHYHHRLLRPLFMVFIIGYVLNWLIQINQLGNVVVFELFDNPVAIRAIFYAAVGTYLWLGLVWVLQDVLQRLIDQHTEADSATIEATLTLTRYVLIGAWLIFIFSEMQLNPAVVGGITAGLAGGVAFGSKDIVNNFISGILLLFERSVRPGDTVEIDGTMGVISAMNIRSTTIQGYDGREVIVPNEKILTSSVTTYTKSSRHARIQINIGVSYEADPKQVLEILRAIPPQHPQVLEDPTPNAFLMEFADSSINFSVFAWVADLNQKFTTQHDLTFRIWDALAENGIEIPYPQQEVHLRDLPWESIVGEASAAQEGKRVTAAKNGGEAVESESLTGMKSEERGNAC